MPQIKENFFENILFRFESCSCDCVTDLEHIAPGEEPIRKYKLQALPESKLLFAYAAKKGLVRIAPNGTIEEANVLGTLMALPSKSVKELSSFMKENGFLFPVSAGRYEEIDASILYSIMERLRMTVELMTAANEIQKDYQKIFLLTINLLFAGDLTIQTDAMAQAYSTKHHSYIDLLQSANLNVSYEREHEAFNSDFYTVADTIYGSYQLPIQEYNDIKGGYSTKPGFNDPLFRNIMGLYLNLESSGIEKNITDLLFHYFHEVGMLDFSNGLAYYEEPNLDAFTKEYSSTDIPQKRLHMISFSWFSNSTVSMSSVIRGTSFPFTVKLMSQSVIASMRLPMASVTVPSMRISSYRSYSLLRSPMSAALSALFHVPISFIPLCTGCTSI